VPLDLGHGTNPVDDDAGDIRHHLDPGSFDRQRGVPRRRSQLRSIESNQRESAA
jgi:hypothetical protein